MSELKTLKDLEGYTLADNNFVLDYDEDDGCGYVLYNNPVSILRSEAIKWVKELLNVIWKEDHPFYNFRHDVYPIADFIKDRFNLTDEDFEQNE